MVENGLNVETSGSDVHYEFVVYDDNKQLSVSLYYINQKIK